MKRVSTSIAVAVLAAASCVALLGPVPLSWAGQSQATTPGSVSESPPGAAVFEMKYRGLDTPDDPLSYRSFWGFGSPGGNQGDPFVTAVKAKVKDCTPVYNGMLAKARWSVVELNESKEPVAFYFDLNGDGQLSDNEKFPQAKGSSIGFPFVFVTSDFQVRTREGQEVPFRAMLVANRSGGPGEYSFMWSPHCVLEGQGTLAGTPVKLILTANGFDGSFTTFGRGSFGLIPADQQTPRYLPRSTLSSVINYQGTFYRLRLADKHAPDSLACVTLEKDTTPTGRASVTVAGKEGLKTRFSGLQLQGDQDNTIQFFLSEAEPTLPVGKYRVPYGYLNYGSASAEEWNVNFNDAPSLDITAAQTARLELGQPTLTVRALEEKDRNLTNAKERSTFAKGTPIYLGLQIKGKAGEAYMRFSQIEAAPGRRNDVKPHVLITASDGKQIASTDMEYG